MSSNSLLWNTCVYELQIAWCTKESMGGLWCNLWARLVNCTNSFVIPVAAEVSFDCWECLLNWVVIWRIWWEKDQFAHCMYVSFQSRNSQCTYSLASSSTSFWSSSEWCILQLSRTSTLLGPGYGFVNGSWLGQASVSILHWRHVQLTTISLMNLTNLSAVMGPSMMSHVMRPSNVRIGRIEYRTPRTKTTLETHCVPSNDHPYRRNDVRSSFADSSVNMSISGSHTNLPMRFMYAAQRIASRSIARALIRFLEKCHLPHGAWQSRDWDMNTTTGCQLFLQLVEIQGWPPLYETA